MASTRRSWRRLSFQAARELFALAGVAWEGRNDAELAALRPAYRSAHLACQQDDERAWQQGSLSLFEEQMVDAQGEPRHFEVRKLPLFETDGRRKALVVIGREITAQLRHEHEQRIAAITFESQEGMLVADAAGTILRANQAFLEQTGYSLEEVVGRRAGLLKSGRHDANFYRQLWQILEGEGYWQGEIWNRRKGGEIYPAWLTITAVRDGDAQLSHYVATYSDVTERKAAEQQIRDLAFYDPLTALPNRRLLQDRLQQALASSQRSGVFGALLFIDLDNFKILNDTLGHLVGDQLLIEVAQRLKGCVRDEDTVARLGGDEFVVLLEHLHRDAECAARQAEQVAEKIFAAINRPFLLREREYRSSPSIGVSLFNELSVEGDELLKQADMAMYQAKAAGRNTIRFFDPSMQHLVEAKAELQADLHRALEGGQLLLHYQPQYHLDGGIHGIEALLRWCHPQRGMVAPGDFIPLAEECSLILPLGQWVLERACQQLRQWQGTSLERVPLAVNISARQFRQSDFVAQVQQALAVHGVAPGRLKLELTESLVLDDIDDTIAKMRRLRALGCLCSLDDFGTGYSSLAYLRRLPLDELKIDQCFVRELGHVANDETIVRAIITLAKGLQLRVVAEGVESEQQRRILSEQGCEVFQGFLLGRPLAQQALEHLLAAEVTSH